MGRPTGAPTSDPAGTRTGDTAQAPQVTEARATSTRIWEDMRRSGRWNPLWDGVETIDPDGIDRLLRTTVEPYDAGVLPPVVVELICIAVDASPLHMYEAGARRHIRRALDLGVTPREILEVLKLSATVGIHALNVGVPALMDELAEREKREGRGAGVDAD